MKVKGLGEVLKALHELPAKVQKKVVKGAVASAAEVIRAEAELRAPIYTGTVQAGHPPPGTLKKAIYKARLASACTATVETWLVSARKGKKQEHDAFYATWVEYGHYARGPSARSAEERKALDAGTHVPLGSYFILAQPFMRPAFESKKLLAYEAMRSYVEDKLPAAVKG